MFGSVEHKDLPHLGVGSEWAVLAVEKWDRFHSFATSSSNCCGF